MRGATFSGGEVSFDYATFSDGAVSFDRATFSGGAVTFFRTSFSDGLVIFAWATAVEKKSVPLGASFKNRKGDAPKPKCQPEHG